MGQKLFRSFFLGILILFLPNITIAYDTSLELKEGWKIQDSAKVKASSLKSISEFGFSTRTWENATVPSTVLGALVDNGSVADPYYGMNFRKLPGTFGAIATNISDVDVPSNSPFSHAWWYRNEFFIPDSFAGKSIDLRLDGITYSADIWLNGEQIATSQDVAGTYRTYVFDVSKQIQIGQKNILAISINPSTPTSLTPSWVDWNPTPPDRNMGLWRKVSLTSHGSVAINDPQVITHLDSTASDTSPVAHLKVEADLSNSSIVSVTGTLTGTLDGISFSQDLTLAANESRTVSFDSESFSQLVLSQPRLWWPAQMAKDKKKPDLYSLHLEFKTTDGQLSDTSTRRVGIREVTSSLTDAGSRLFKINGKPIMIRGGGWSSDLFLRESRSRLLNEIEYVKALNLNTIRLEGRFEVDALLDLTDQEGILVMPGWVCCNSWQEPDKWPQENYKIAEYSTRDQIRNFRAHPSVFVFLYGSDEVPPPAVEQIYLDAFSKYHWPNPILSSASSNSSPITGESGVKMHGPYDYVPPSYWLSEKSELGGAWGFNTETSPGASVPPLESLKNFIPEKHLWTARGPKDKFWTYHTGNGLFEGIEHFTSALDARYGKAASVEEYAMKSQVLAYDGQRAMFEAYGKNKYHSATGVVQWMLNNGWPSLIWHLYDYYLRAGGGYFGVKKANEPIHIQYSYDDRTVVVVNSTYEDVSHLNAKIQLFDFDLNPLYAQEETIDIVADSSKVVTQVPDLPTTQTYFIKLELEDSQSNKVSDNFYWLSTQKEVFDWEHSDFTHTPLLKDGDLTLLNQLPKVSVQVTGQFSPTTGEGTVTLSNPSASLAFFVHLALLDHSKKEILPNLWDDNYISLMPGETRVIHVRNPSPSRDASFPEIQVDGWNIKPSRYKLTTD